MNNFFLILFITFLYGQNCWGTTALINKISLVNNVSFMLDSSYSTKDIKNLALAIAASSYKKLSEAIDQIDNSDLKNLAIAKTANSYGKKDEAINRIQNKDFKNLAIAITASSYKELNEAIEAIGK